MANPKPTGYLDWTDGDPSKVVEPTTGQKTTGWVDNEGPPFQYANWQIWLIDNWIKYFDEAININSDNFNPEVLRLLGGGLWSWNLGTSTFGWSANAYISSVGIEDSVNTILPSSVTINEGEIAYVVANIPFLTTGDAVIGSFVITNLAFQNGISPGQNVYGSAFAPGTTVISVSGDQAVISAAATSSGSDISIRFVAASNLTVLVAAIEDVDVSINIVPIARRDNGRVYVGVNAWYMALVDGESKRLNENSAGTTSLTNTLLTQVKKDTVQDYIEGVDNYLSYGALNLSASAEIHDFATITCNSGGVNGDTFTLAGEVFTIGAGSGQIPVQGSPLQLAQYLAREIRVRSALVATYTTSSTSGLVNIYAKNAGVVGGAISKTGTSFTLSGVALSGNTTRKVITSSGVQRQLDDADTNIYSILQAGVLPWSATTAYTIGALVNVSGKVYVSKSAGNTNNAVSNTTFWKLFGAGITTTAISYAVLAADDIVRATAACTLTLPAVAAVPVGQKYTLKNATPSAIVTYQASGAETIDGSNTYIADNSGGGSRDSVTVVNNGTSWDII